LSFFLKKTTAMPVTTKTVSKKSSGQTAKTASKKTNPIANGSKKETGIKYADKSAGQPELVLIFR
jgi:hypothetical protein